TTALQISLDRDIRDIGVLALQQLARGKRRARVGEGTQLLGVAIASQLGKRAREKQIACGDRRLAARDRRDRRPAAAQLGTVDQIVVYECGRMYELHRDGGSDKTLLAL